MTQHPIRSLCRVAAIVLIESLGCSKGAPANPAGETHSTAAAPAALPALGRRYGDAMAEVGQRFERAGRAVVAGRWDLADYDLGELAEVFEGDLPHAERPENVPIDPTPLSAAFAATQLPALLKAVRAHDRVGFDAAYAGASRACNGCHQVASKAFIEVPLNAGDPVPEISPSVTRP